MNASGTLCRFPSGTGTLAGGLLLHETLGLVVRNEVPAALDFAQNTIALHDLGESRNELFGGFAISWCHKQHVFEFRSLG